MILYLHPLKTKINIHYIEKVSSYSAVNTGLLVKKSDYLTLQTEVGFVNYKTTVKLCKYAVTKFKIFNVEYVLRVISTMLLKYYMLISYLRSKSLC